MFANFYKNRSVLVTGHTGFKGSWLTCWLLKLGADVTGFALAPPTSPSLYEAAGLSSYIRDVRGDVRAEPVLSDLLRDREFEVVFHLAAQPLVRDSYQDPLYTLETNIIGSARLLEALRSVRHPCICIMVSSDKCYENREWEYSYREVDSLGGHDPYSASKGAMEIIVSSYSRSFFNSDPVRIASARAGNVIGGGDWQKDRIIPDIIRALGESRAITVRNPQAVRPWQHVLEPLSGYLWLGAALGSDRTFTGAWNFGPASHDAHTVTELVNEAIAAWGSGSWAVDKTVKAPHEAMLLRLSIDKATTRLGWKPVWDFGCSVRATMEWYRDCRGKKPRDTFAFCQRQIESYEQSGKTAGVRWAITNVEESQ